MLKSASLRGFQAIDKKLGWLSARAYPIFSNIVQHVTEPCALVVGFGASP